MRILLQLKAIRDVTQNKINNSKFYTGMHGWIYDKLKQTRYEELHSKKNFKPFCFSNLYPVKGQIIEEGKIYRTWISSPDEMLIISILSNIRINEKVNFGEYSFQLLGLIPKPSYRVDNFTLLTTETITNVCLPVQGSLKPKAITLKKDKNKFQELLKKNIIRKYNQFSDEKVTEDFNLWNNVEITEIPDTESAVKINFVDQDDNWFNVIGSRYRFNLGKLNDKQRQIFQLVHDLGFGERNTFGFGFVNVKRIVKDD